VYSGTIGRMKRIVCNLTDAEHKRVKLASVSQDIEISALVRELLALWLAGKVKLSERKGAKKKSD
jgi:hypothetical protein